MQVRIRDTRITKGTRKIIIIVREEPPSATTRAGSVVNRPEKFVFGRLDPLKQVMVEQSREKHSQHRIN